jgi:hypothetical protein
MCGCKIRGVGWVTVLSEADDVMDCGGEPVPVINAGQFVVDRLPAEVARELVVLGVGETFGLCAAPS